MSEREERKNQRIGLLTSVGIHFAMLVLFLFAMGWSAPNPPLSEYGSGVELNFGLDSEGSGEIQPVTPVGENVIPEKATEADENEKQTKPEEPQKEKEQVKPEDTKVESDLTSKEESPIEVKETKKEIKKTEPPKEKVNDAKEKAVKKEKVEEKVVKDAYVKKTTEGGAKNKAGAPGQGNDKNKVGDKGSPEGSLDPNGQYTGKPGTGGNGGGGGNGFGLQMTGWNWDAPPQAPKLPDNENGRIVFEITVDANGDIERIETKERSLSPEAERLCKEEIQKRSLIRTSGGAAPEKSKGTITFKLRTQ
jgi:outer membrane biosynthesis protein TonB